MRAIFILIKGCPKLIADRVILYGPVVIRRILINIYLPSPAAAVPAGRCLAFKIIKKIRIDHNTSFSFDYTG